MPVRKEICSMVDRLFYTQGEIATAGKYRKLGSGARVSEGIHASLI